jgi:16S rRNA (uracil1498-N3)-methyltransferase
MNVFIARISGNRALLTPEESWHCAKVLRFRAGEKLRLIDGAGNSYDGVLDVVNEKSCEAAVTGGPWAQPPKAYRLHLAIAPTKQIDRIEWMLEKSVEIGIDEITFIQCRNSERTRLNTERMLRIAESAVKQSLQSRIPRINDLTGFESLVSKSQEDIKLIAHCNEGEKDPLAALSFAGKTVLVLVGPEGDFTAEEVKHAIDHGFTAITLGGNRLRTETAGLYVAQALSILSAQTKIN